MNRLIAATALACLIGANAALAASPPQYAPGTPPVATTDHVAGAQDGHTDSAQTDELSTTAQTIRPALPAQIAQPVARLFAAGCVNIFSFLTPKQQDDVRAGESTVDFSVIEARAEAALNMNGGSEHICYPGGTFNFLSTHDIVVQVHIQGAGSGMAGGSATILNFPADTTGFIIDRQHTFGTGTISPPRPTGGDGTIIEGVHIHSAGGGDTNKHGVWMRARAKLRDVYIDGFPGNEINIVATAGSGGATEGNANGWSIDGARLAGPGQNGIYVFGGDVNAGHANGPIDIAGFQAHCIDDESFLGNQYDMPQCAGAGLGAIANRGGVSYALNPTAVAGSGSKAIPGTNLTVWTHFTPFQAGWPAWSPSRTYVHGGGYRCGNYNARTIFSDAYDESGDPPSYGVHPCLVLGGLNVPGWKGDVSWLTNVLGALVNQTGPTGSYTVGTSTNVLAVVGGEPNNGTGLNIADTGTGAAFSNGWRIRIKGKDMITDAGNAASALYATYSGGGTALTFGRTEAVPWAFSPATFMLGDDTGNPNHARNLFVCSAMPSTTGHSVGELCLNKGATVGQPMGWVLTVQGPGGAPDTWTPLAPVAGAVHVSALPACTMIIRGQRSMVDDASSPTFLGALTGRGSVVSPVFCNGSAWVAG
jgi:hypothetical protein